MDASILMFLIENLREVKKAESYVLTFRDLNLQPDTTNEKPFSGDEMWAVVSASQEISVKSQSGLYDKSNLNNPENEHLHEGGVVIKNHSKDVLGSVQFLVVKWIYQ